MRDAFEAARLVRAASVLDVTAEAIVEALESGSAEQAAHEHAWGLSFRDLQVPVPVAEWHENHVL